MFDLRADGFSISISISRHNEARHGLLPEHPQHSITPTCL